MGLLKYTTLLPKKSRMNFICLPRQWGLAPLVQRKALTYHNSDNNIRTQPSSAALPTRTKKPGSHSIYPCRSPWPSARHNICRLFPSIRARRRWLSKHFDSRPHWRNMKTRPQMNNSLRIRDRSENMHNPDPNPLPNGPAPESYAWYSCPLHSQIQPEASATSSSPAAQPCRSASEP